MPNSGLCHPCKLAAGDDVLDKHGRIARVLYIMNCGQTAVIKYAPGTVFGARVDETPVRELTHVADALAALK